MARKSGFTLIELMVTVAIASIVLLAGVPSLIEFIRHSRASQQASYVSSALQVARMSAIDSAQVIGVCPAKADLSACSTSWDDAIMIFIDADNSKTFNSGDTVIHSVEAAPESITRSFNNGTVIQYQAEGHTTQFGTFKICDSSKEAAYARSVVINLQGRIKLSKDYNGNGVHEYPSGTELSCVASSGAS
ncbi:GspH/FimT family pseudopilin [Echinimonas agarilytica]|uniref:Type II secretion system protein H n=1 Tax=Echinimonas agarilytica TaxID=1215918 RepID=A0AA41W8R9_9GAMM|nr:GspH/FimT family pseudopilin [Echinimonas agarilytica]MCM2680612.1 GspH/FimT family pseudopilin [Echinimonas agarilytica]